MTLETTKSSKFSTELFDTRELRDALGTFATGVTIVTAKLPTANRLVFSPPIHSPRYRSIHR